MTRARLPVLLVVAAAWLGPHTESDAQTVTRHTTQAGLAFRYVHMPPEQSQALYFAWKDGSAVALPGKEALPSLATALIMQGPRGSNRSAIFRSEEHTSELQSLRHLVCRLLLEKK